MPNLTYSFDKFKFDSLIKKLEINGSSFVIATVTRTMSSTAVKPGMKAIISNKGEIVEGWLGGSCVTSAVKRTSLETLKLNKPKLLIIRPDLIRKDLNDEQVLHTENHCPSEGSMDIFIEPFYPRPLLILYGKSPIAQELEKIGNRFNFNVLIKDQSDSLKKMIQNNSHTELEIFSVIATQGTGDLEALIDVFNYKSKYIGLVASKKKFGVLKDKILQNGIKKKDVLRIVCPAGISINALLPEEVALSIFAEIIQIKRSGKMTNAKY